MWVTTDHKPLKNQSYAILSSSFMLSHFSRPYSNRVGSVSCVMQSRLHSITTDSVLAQVKHPLCTLALALSQGGVCLARFGGSPSGSSGIIEALGLAGPGKTCPKLEPAAAADMAICAQLKRQVYENENCFEQCMAIQVNMWCSMYMLICSI
jgi:hypothetical protein